MIANQFAMCFYQQLQSITSENWIESDWMSFWIPLMFILSVDFAVQNVCLVVCRFLDLHLGSLPLIEK
jgi:hypothetical protein